jgi:hypothetical protein
MTAIDSLAAKYKYEASFLWLCKVKALGAFVKGAVGIVKQAKDIGALAKVLERPNRSFFATRILKSELVRLATQIPATQYSIVT